MILSEFDAWLLTPRRRRLVMGKIEALSLLHRRIVAVMRHGREPK